MLTPFSFVQENCFHILFLYVVTPSAYIATVQQRVDHDVLCKTGIAPVACRREQIIGQREHQQILYVFLYQS